jgi:hypothetical protein
MLVEPAQLAARHKTETRCNRTGRRLSGKKSARGADLSTYQSLLRLEHHGLRVRQMAVIESWSEAEG